MSEKIKKCERIRAYNSEEGGRLYHWCDEIRLDFLMVEPLIWNNY